MQRAKPKLPDAKRPGIRSFVFRQDGYELSMQGTDGNIVREKRKNVKRKVFQSGQRCVIL